MSEQKGVPDMALELLVAAGHITQAKADEALRLARKILGEPEPPPLPSEGEMRKEMEE